MNEQAIQKVISEYAMENANLRIIVATLQAQLEEAQREIEKLQNQREKKDELQNEL